MMMDKQATVDTYEREVFAAMTEEKPLVSYLKTIVGKVHLTVLNPFSGKPEPVTLYGTPSANNPRAVVEVWSTKDDLFFKKMNREHLDAGTLKVLSVQEEVARQQEPDSPNAITDEEIAEILNKPFLALKNKLNSFTAPAPVYRFERMAEEMEKSEKILEAIRARASELELGEEPEAE
jgi:hypothetical protein